MLGIIEGQQSSYLLIKYLLSKVKKLTNPRELTCVLCSSLTISGGSSAARSGGKLIAGISESRTGCQVGIKSDIYPER